MMIDLDGRTKILFADAIKFPAGADPATDTLLVVDPKTHRPLGVYRPAAADVGATPRRGGRRPAATEPEPGPEPEPEPPAVPEASEPPAPATAVGMRGPLSAAHKLQLAQLWRKHPDWDADAIADEFAAVAGRPITEATAANYRPAAAANGKP